MREFTVRLTVRTNDREDEDERGEPYYDDAEMCRVISTWIEGALEDRDDSPQVIWGEVTLRPDPLDHTHQFRLPVRDDHTCVALPGCPVTYAQERARRREAGS